MFQPRLPDRSTFSRRVYADGPPISPTTLTVSSQAVGHVTFQGRGLFVQAPVLKGKRFVWSFRTFRPRSGSGRRF